ERLEQFLAARSEPAEIKIEQLTNDASTREYFRVGWKETVATTAIACVYPVQNDPQQAAYVDVTGLFLSGGLPVAQILAVDDELAIVVHQDFGDNILRSVLEGAPLPEKDEWLNSAIALIAKIQAATGKAYEMNSIASRLKFDEEKLNWELN